MNKKFWSYLLALVMLFSVVAIPGQALAKDADISKDVKKSYIKATSTLGKADYTTITTFGGTSKTGKTYKNVVRGNIYYAAENEAALKNVKVNLKAQKNYGFTLNGQTVQAGGNADFTLDLTKTNVIELNIPKTDKKFEEGSYTISGGVKGQTVTINVGLDVSNPQAWLDGTYKPKMETPGHKGHKDEAKVRNALEGFAQVGETTIVVPKGTTATEVFRKFGEINKVTMEGLDQGYIRRINKQGFDPIGEFDINNYSGWMYTVNYAVDKDAKVLDSSKWFMPNVGVAGQTFNKNAAMRWNFTMAYGQDIDAGWGEPGGGDMPTALRSYRFAPSIEDLVPQWANSGRVLTQAK
ncbi:hypothetical protein [Urinicoccus massiliensis]|uniref:hypothetical protein n=1 Tax=Urinicoccus massiliensis TaxID=1723382 RepID=UPI00021A34A2|nr:hypothetical protein [Urinicoccus massiliensis]EGS31469.1 hypothetical protein HMPREF9130_0143 [Peptoniphilus sp. oral taxon 375 str. F0436]